MMRIDVVVELCKLQFLVNTLKKQYPCSLRTFESLVDHSHAPSINGHFQIYYREYLGKLKR